MTAKDKHDCEHVADDGPSLIDRAIEAYTTPYRHVDDRQTLRSILDAEIARFTRQLREAGRPAGLFDSFEIRLRQLDQRVTALEELQAGRSVKRTAKQAK